MTPTINQSDLQQPRTQAELRAWADGIHQELVQTESGEQAIRLNRGNLVKQFKEEIWPLVLFADAFYKGRVDVLFPPVIGNQSYDALILETSSSKVLHHLQITQSFNGEENHLRMLHLVEYGHAPVTGTKPQKEKVTGRVQKIWPEVVRHDQVLHESFNAIRGAVLRKSDMRYESNTSLIIEFTN